MYGDSHAQAISDYLNVKFLERGIKGIKIELDGCHVVPNIIDTKESIQSKRECAYKFNNLISFLKFQNSDVIAISRWTFRLYPVKDHIKEMPYKNSEGGLERESYREYAVITSDGLKFDGESKKAALGNFIDALLNTNLRIFLIYPVPEIAWDVSKENWKYLLQYSDISLIKDEKQLIELKKIQSELINDKILSKIGIKEDKKQNKI